MKYEKFLLEESEKPAYPTTNQEGLISISNNISEIEQLENLSQSNILLAIFYTICEIFDIDNIEMMTNSYANSFIIIINEETKFNNQKGIESPKLSREKLKNGNIKDISEAIIDLIKNRKQWTNERFYKTINL